MKKSVSRGGPARILLFVLAAALLGACLDPEPDREPTQYRDAFFPMAVGNSWTYHDTLIVPDASGDTSLNDTLSSVVRLEITRYRIDSTGATWWTFATSSTFLTPGALRSSAFELMQRGDTVYQRLGGERAPSIAFIYPRQGFATFRVPNDSGMVFVGVNALGEEGAPTDIIHNFVFEPDAYSQLYCDELLVPGVGVTWWTCRMKPMGAEAFTSTRRMRLADRELRR